MARNRLTVTVYVCPVCLTAGSEGRCPHYESGSVGWVHYTRLSAEVVVQTDWTPVLDSRDSPQKDVGDGS
jgi:hypothetical protein